MDHILHDRHRGFLLSSVIQQILLLDGVIQHYDRVGRPEHFGVRFGSNRRPKLLQLTIANVVS